MYRLLTGMAFGSWVSFFAFVDTISVPNKENVAVEELVDIGHNTLCFVGAHSILAAPKTISWI